MVNVAEIITVDPFIYRINPGDYISVTESLINNRNLFREIDELKKTNSKDLLKKYSYLLKRWKINPPEEIEKLYEDFEKHKYFYKELGASLKFNPLSESDACVFILDKISVFLRKYTGLIKPKAVYRLVDIIPDQEGLHIKGSDIHFNSRKLKMFSGHSSFKSDKEIFPNQLVSEKLVVYVVTIGPGIDDEVKALSDKGEIFDAYLLNGIGAGAAEMVANDLDLFFNDNYNSNNRKYKRLSPGYGDWHITDQEKIFRLLSPEERIGVKLTDSHIMLPEKSTSGIMGIVIT